MFLGPSLAKITKRNPTKYKKTTKQQQQHQNENQRNNIKTKQKILEKKEKDMCKNIFKML